MLLKRELGKKGQVVIPKDIREYMGLRPGAGVLFEARGGEVVLRPEKNPAAIVEEFCRTPRKLKKRLNIKKILEEEYDLS